MCLTGCNSPTPPSGGHDAGQACDATDATCQVAKPCDHTQPSCQHRVEIEINNTPATNDDVVQVKCTHPNHRHKVPCRAKLLGPPTSGMTVVLTNPDGRLRFPEAGDSTATLSLAADGSWSTFEISGENASGAMNDAVIQAHLDTAGGAIKGSKTVTVFTFDEAEIKITATGAYNFVGNSYTATGGHAADFAAKARIRPAGIDCSVPQVVNLRIGIMQESSNFQSTKTWNNPTIAWAPGVPSGTVINVAASINGTTAYAPTVSQPVADTDSIATPLYDQPGISNTVDPNSTKPPIGCAGGSSATSFDTPSGSVTPTLVRQHQNAGVTVATLTYKRATAGRTEHFRTFCVVFNTSTKQICALRQATWDLNVSSTGAAAQKATPNADGPATVDPVVGPPFANTVPQPTTITESGTTNFTKS